MKMQYKKLGALTLAVCLALCSVACGDKKPDGAFSSALDSSAEINSPADESASDNSSPAVSAEYAYKITIQNEQGVTIEGVTVKLFDGDTEIAAKNTDADGNAIFKPSDVSKAGAYKIRVFGVAAGYGVDENSVTDATLGTQRTLTIKPLGKLLDGAPEKGSFYKTGDVLHDFSITDVNGNTYTLSELLKEKDAVVLNFWFVSCGPCRAEFPYMNAAYNSALAEDTSLSYSDKIEILAISVKDSASDVASFKYNMELLFPMFSYSASVINRFYVYAAPTTIIIDRNGVMCYSHVGAITSTSEFTNLFNLYTRDDYKTTLLPPVT